MSVSLKKSILFLLLIISACSANAQNRSYDLVSKKDTSNVYKKMLRDMSDDLMENHPAEDLYNNIWTSERLNPYKMPIDSLPDSVRIDCSNYHIPIYGRVTSHFGPRRYRYHFGIDLALNIGDSIVSSFSGKVRIIDYEQGGYGNYVVIRHDNGLETVYAHLSAVLVNLNQKVKAGELIAYGGNTGRSTGPHLHYETRYLGNAINPEHIIDFSTGKVHNKDFELTKKLFYFQRQTRAVAVTKYYTVRKGDNLSEIAARNGTSVKALTRLNNLGEKVHLKPGQKLRVR